ncbi:hypothetical protein ACLB2K_002428 [Fragaria x ananassa]
MGFLRLETYSLMGLVGRLGMDDRFMPGTTLGCLGRVISNPLAVEERHMLVILLWNHSLLSDSFDPVDVEIIQAIPLSNQSIPDRLVWHYDVKVRFSTKSAYVLARQLNQSQPSASVGESVQNFWKKVWFSKAPGKVKVHIWRVCSSILPTVSAMRTKRVFVENGGFFCNNPDETIEHVSRDCWFTRELVKQFPEVSRCGGIGVVIRDSNSFVVGGVCLKVEHISFPDMVEAVAGRVACELALEF